MIETKRCTKCRLDKPLTDFPIRKDRGNKPRSHCRPCHNEAATQQASKIRQRSWRYKRKYGISLQEFDQMFADQGGKCAICTKEFGSESDAMVDHHHGSGRVRGLLCRGCNLAIGYLRDDPVLMWNAAEYVGCRPGEGM